MSEQAQDILLKLGFNQVEAQVYICLLPLPPTTAYKIGKIIGRQTANVYKAVESLRQKGAVIVEQGKSQMCRAVPIEELMEHLRNDFSERSQKAEKALQNLRPAIADEKNYEIESVSFALNRGRSMLRSAKKIVVLDIFPDVLNLLREEIVATAERGVRVYLQTYAPSDIPNVATVVPQCSPELISHWNSQQMNIVVDARECLIALFDYKLENILQATWSNNLYLSCILHAGIMKEHRLFHIENMISEGIEVESLQSYFQEQLYFHNDQIPGNLELLQRYGRPEILKSLGLSIENNN